MQGFQQAKADFEALDARVMGVSSDSFASQGAFAEKNGIEFPLLSDWPDSKTIAAFGIGRDGAPTANRVTFVFDAEGVVRAVIDDAEAQLVGVGMRAAVDDIADHERFEAGGAVRHVLDLEADGGEFSGDLIERCIRVEMLAEPANGELHRESPWARVGTSSGTKP